MHWRLARTADHVPAPTATDAGYSSADSGRPAPPPGPGGPVRSLPPRYRHPVVTHSGLSGQSDGSVPSAVCGEYRTLSSLLCPMAWILSRLMCPVTRTLPRPLCAVNIGLWSAGSGVSDSVPSTIYVRWF